MKIANKIMLLIVFLLCVLAANTWVGLRQMNNIRSVFMTMAEYDVSFVEGVTAVHQLQLQKNVLLQQIIGIAEELGFETITFARSSYLQDQLKNIHEGLGKYAQMSDQATVRAHQAAEAVLKIAHDANEREHLQGMVDGLNALQALSKKYDDSISKMLGSVEKGGFQLSLEDLEAIQREENDLSKDVEDLLKQAQNFSKASLVKTGEWEAQAEHGLLISLWTTAVFGCFLALWIVRSIVRPLRALSQAAHQIGDGNFNVRLKVGSKDELSQVSGAFNTMSQQLEDFRVNLEKKNRNLEEVNADMDKFIQIMGHDIANPLTVMIASCGYIEQHAGPNMDPKNLDALQGIRRASTKMHQMVKDLLQFTKSKRLK